MPQDSHNVENVFTTFVVGTSREVEQSKNAAFLVEDNWDDWFEYSTLYTLVVFDASGARHEIGGVKIGQFLMQPGQRRPNLPKDFQDLGERFFSLGQDERYYANLTNLGDAIRESVLTGLRDVAFKPAIWEEAKAESVMHKSLLRSVTVTSVERQYRRIAHGGARLTPYSFSYSPPKRLGDGQPPFLLDFEVEPESKPPTNVHVLIGRNGVGKTHLLRLMTKCLVAADAVAKQSGKFSWSDPFDLEKRFSNLVTISFSAFDDSELLPEDAANKGSINYSYIGLRRNNQSNKSFGKPKSTEILALEFVDSLKICQVGVRRRRWLAALSMLDTDLVFRTAGLSTIIDYDFNNEESRKQVIKLFKRLSSGHMIVILTITRLVETVEEKTLVLLDEPEAHLHPPLLSAFIRALSSLLVDRNGVAIVATHSPVVLQEVPKTCVWILNRIHTESGAERPSLETFGEHVGILTREVFQLELRQSGFQKLLEEALETNASYEDAVSSFHEQLGAEARAVLRAMFAQKQLKG